MTRAAPIDSAARIGELDVLRGFALLGVFIVHFVGAAYYTLPLDATIAETWKADPLHFAAVFLSDLFFVDKANTLFATLFGMGFWIMLERLRASGRDFERIYLRRLLALLLIGVVNLLLLFPGDVLHEYALLGLLLYLLRDLSARSMLVLGLGLALLGGPLVEHLLDALSASSEGYDADVEAAFAHGGYLNWVVVHAGAHADRELVNGMVLGWAAYLFGRFLLGAWIVRRGWIRGAGHHRAMLRRIVPWVVFVGFSLEAASMAIWMDVLDLPDGLDMLFHRSGAPLLAIGYALGLIVLFHSERGYGLAELFAPVGRIALTAYVGHGAVFTLLYFPFGLDLLGVLPPAGGLLAALAVFAGFTMFAHLWLTRYRFGPLEYLWRWATYGERPAFRRA